MQPDAVEMALAPFHAGIVFARTDFRLDRVIRGSGLSEFDSVPSRAHPKLPRARTKASLAVLLVNDDTDPVQATAAPLAANAFSVSRPSGAHPVARAGVSGRSERIRAMLREHKVRARIFRGSALVDTGWNMLLDLMLAHLEGRQIYLSSLCVASGQPITNGKRRVAQLIADGLVQRENDRADRRRVLVSLTHSGLERLAAYLDQIERDDARWERA